MLSIPFLCLRAAQNYPRGPLRHALVPGKQVAATGRELASNGSACFARRFALLSPVAARILEEPEDATAALHAGLQRQQLARAQREERRLRAHRTARKHTAGTESQNA